MKPEAVQDEKFVFGDFKRRMRYLPGDALSMGGYLLVLWPWIGRTGFETNSPTVIVGWVLISFCLHMATIRLLLNQLAIINGIKQLLNEKFDMDKEKLYEVISNILEDKPVTAKLKTGVPVRLSLTEDKSGKIEIHMRKAG